MPVRLKFFPLAFGLLLILGALGHPAAAQSPRHITLEDALELARENSPRIQQAASQARGSEAALRAENRWFLPRLSLSVGPTQRYGLAFDQTAGQLVQQTSESMYAGIGTSITLFSGFEHRASAEQAEAQHRSDRLSRNRQAETVTFEVLSEYLRVLQAREQLQIQEDALAEEEKLLGRTKELTEAGIRPATDLFRLQRSVASRRLSINQMRRSWRQAQAELIATIGLEQTGRYRFEVPPLDTAGALPDYEAGDLIQRAKSSRADLQAQQAAATAAGHGVQVAQSRRWPALSLSGSAGTNYTSVRPKGLGSQLTDNRSGSVGLNLQIPLFAGPQAEQQVTQAQVRRRNAELELDRLQRQAAKEVRQALTEYRLIREALPMARTQLEAARKALDSARRRYGLGNATFTELSEARQGYVNAQSQLAQTRYAVTFQQKILDYYTGALQIEN